jgi:hypothetical protein
MWNTIVCLLIGLFAEVAPWDPALLNPPPVPRARPVTMPAEPSTLVLALIGAGIFAAFAGVQRWRRVQPTKTTSAPQLREAAPEPRKRGAA